MIFRSCWRRRSNRWLLRDSMPHTPSPRSPSRIGLAVGRGHPTADSSRSDETRGGSRDTAVFRRLKLSASDDERSSRVRAVVFRGDELPIPRQDGVGRDEAGDDRQSPPAEDLALHHQATTLIISPPQSPSSMRCAKDSVLLEQIVNDGRLLSVNPAGEQQAEERRRPQRILPQFPR